MAAETTIEKLESETSTHDRSRAIVEILVIMAVGLPFSISGYFLEDQQSAMARLLPVIGVFVSLAMTGVFARFNGYTWKDLGLGRPKSWTMTVAWGFVSAICCLLVAAVVLSVANSLFASEPDLSRFDVLKNNPLQCWRQGIFSAWFVAAIPEEIMFRGYMLGQVIQCIRRAPAHGMDRKLGHLHFGLVWFRAFLPGTSWYVCHWFWRAAFLFCVFDFQEKPVDPDHCPWINRYVGFHFDLCKRECLASRWRRLALLGRQHGVVPAKVVVTKCNGQGVCNVGRFRYRAQV